jgi:PAS domain S-box-containing protein
VQFTPYVLPVAASAVLMAALALATWRHRPAPGTISFCLLLLATAEWSLSYALELTSRTFSIALFWDNATWIGATAAPTLWLVFALSYTGRARWLMRPYLAILAIEPLIALLLIWTNGYHGLVEHASMNTSGHYAMLAITYGVFYWINIVYSYVLLLLGALILSSFILTIARSAYLYLAQGACLLLAVAAPWLGNFLTISGLNPLPFLNLTPVAFLISGLAYSAGLFIFRFLDLVPIARELVIENMKEATIVLDIHNRIVDINPAAQRLASCKASRAVGRSFAEVFTVWPELVAACNSHSETDEEVIASGVSPPRYFAMRSTPLYRLNGHATVSGRLVVLRDVSERVQAERAMRESEERFRNIFAEVPIGMAIVDLQGHVLQVNKAFCEMLGYDKQELIGLDLATISHPDDVGADMFLSRKALSGEMSSYKVEKRYVKKNQETLWADLTATILRNQEGEAMYGLVMLENIIERKRAKLLEEERHHVAYELHDGLAQVAVSTHQHLQALASRYHPRSPQARQELSTALELAQRSVREARRLIAGLRPTVLDDFGLAMALRLQIEAQRNDGWNIIFDEALGPQRLPPKIETTLFGVAQEALTNVRKHSGSTQARLSLTRQDSNIRLEVQDWGSGFEPRTLFKVYRPGEHVGIRTMQERVELLGGRLLFSSHPGFGTLVVAEVPILPSNAKDQYNPSDASWLEAAPPGLISTDDLDEPAANHAAGQPGQSAGREGSLSGSHQSERSENHEH